MKYFVLFILFFVSNCFAQTEPGEAFIKQIMNNDIVYNEPSINNRADVRQIGYENQAIINQLYTGLASNNAGANQLGMYNSLNINHSGSGNSSIANQNGLYNSYELDLNGYQNKTAVFQNGANNSVEQEINGENLSYLIVQNGFNNKVIQTENSPSSRPYEITQTGIGLRLEITNGYIIR